MICTSVFHNVVYDMQRFIHGISQKPYKIWPLEYLMRNTNLTQTPRKDFDDNFSCTFQEYNRVHVIKIILLFLELQDRDCFQATSIAPVVKRNFPNLHNLVLAHVPNRCNRSEERRVGKEC